MPIFKKTKPTILFDLDGTLLDTAHDLTMAFNQVIAKYSNKTYTLAETRKMVGYGSKQLFDMALAENNLAEQDFEQFKQEFRVCYLQLGHQKTVLFDGIAAMIDALNRHAIAWGIVTNKPESSAKIVLQHFPTLSAYQCLVGGDTAQYPKPAPEPLLYACELLAIKPSQALFVGDTPVDLEAGYHAGIDTVAVAYGYGIDDMKHSNYQPKAWIDQPEQLLDLIE